MHILILHMRYAPEATGTAPLVTQLAEDLSARGEQVSVITSVPHYGRRAVPQQYRRGLLQHNKEAGVDVWRTAAFPYWSGQVVGRGLDYMFYTLIALWAGLRVTSPDVVLAIAPPITVGPLAWFVSRFRGAPLVFNAQDIWPDGLIRMGRLSNGLAIRLFRILEGWTYRAADRIVVVSEGMRQNLTAKGVPREKVGVIANWVDLSTIKPAPHENPFRKEHDLNGHFVVLFAGNLGYAADLDLIVEAAEFCRSSEEIIFLLVGEGSAKKGFEEKVQSRSLANVRFLPTQPEARLSEMLSAADLSLVTLRPGMGGLSVPSKTYAYMASARPVLAATPEDSAIKGLIEEAECGGWVPAGDPIALGQAILDWKDKAQELKAMGQRGRAYAERFCGRERAIDQHHQVIRSVAIEEAL